ncbi:hypothetical protein HOA55_01590, partial [archaeon]|nr:hypothetical protein [archaeon]MBT6820027.1 hypothetical protein [archaeon]MBT7025372.1 hypothetical protein [archaeon]MBT7238446.1 hypothetical protein [archaeon]
MDDANATSVEDYVGSNNGTIVNAVQTDAGKFGKGFAFDGDGDYVGVPENSSFDLSTFTLSTWVKSNDEGYILAKNGTAGSASADPIGSGTMGTYDHDYITMTGSEATENTFAWTFDQNGDIWRYDWTAGPLYKFNGTTGVYIKTVALADDTNYGYCLQIAVDLDGRMYCSGYTRDRVTVFWPENGTSIASHPMSGTTDGAAGVYFDGKYIWYGDNMGSGGNEYYRVNVTNGGWTVINNFTSDIASWGFGMAVVGDVLIIASSTGDQWYYHTDLDYSDDSMSASAIQTASQGASSYTSFNFNGSYMLRNKYSTAVVRAYQTGERNCTDLTQCPLYKGGCVVSGTVIDYDLDGDDDTCSAGSWGAASGTLVVPYSLSTIGGGQFFIGSGSTNYTVNSTTNVNDFDWHHVAATYNGSMMGIYVDGVLEGSNTSFNGDLSGSGGDVRVGADHSAVVSGFFNGSLDEVLIFNESLSSDEIRGLYNASRISYTETGLAQGAHEFRGYTSDLSGNIGTSEEDFFVDSVLPVPSFVNQTPADDSSQSATAIAVNLSVTESNDHYSFVDFDNDLLGWWRFDNLNGSGDPIDSSSYGNNGTAVADAVQTDAGKFGKGFSFDGTSDHINLGQSASLNLTGNNFTMTAWIYPRTVTGYDGAFLARGSYPASGFRFFTYSNYKLYFDNFNGSHQTIVTSSAVINQDEWNFVSVTKNGNNYTLYANGVLEKTQLGPSYFIDQPARDLLIGSNDNLGGQDKYFNGSVDEVMVFSRSLDSTEIAALYNTTVNYYHNFTGLTEETHNFTGYAVDIAGNVQATSEYNVVVSGTDVGDCDFDLDTPDLVYQLTGDLATTGTCLNVTADNVTIDLMGYNISGDDGSSDYGVLSNGYNRTWVKNGSITGFGVGVNYTNSNDGNITEVAVVSNSVYGIYLGGSTGNNVSENDLKGCGTSCIWFDDADSNFALDNEAGYDSGYGGGTYAVYVDVDSDLNNITLDSSNTPLYVNGDNNRVGGDFNASGSTYANIQMNGSGKTLYLYENATFNTPNSGSLSSSRHLEIIGSNVIVDLAGYNISGNSTGLLSSSSDYHTGVYSGGNSNVVVKNGGIHKFNYGVQINNADYFNITNVSIINTTHAGLYPEFGNTATDHVVVDSCNFTDNSVGRTASGYGIYAYSGTNWTVTNNFINSSGSNYGYSNFYLENSNSTITNNNFSGWSYTGGLLVIGSYNNVSGNRGESGYGTGSADSYALYVNGDENNIDSNVMDDYDLGGSSYSYVYRITGNGNNVTNNALQNEDLSSTYNYFYSVEGSNNAISSNSITSSISGGDSGYGVYVYGDGNVLQSNYNPTGISYGGSGYVYGTYIYGNSNTATNDVASGISASSAYVYGAYVYGDYNNLTGSSSDYGGHSVNSGYGIVVYGDNNRVDSIDYIDSISGSYTYGILLESGSEYNTIYNNGPDYNDYGIYLSYADYNTIDSNSAYYSDDSGINVYYSNWNTLSSNTFGTCYGSFGYNACVNLYSSDNNNFTSTQVYDCTVSGYGCVGLYSSDYNTFTGETYYDSDYEIVTLQGNSKYNNFSDIDLGDASADAVRVYDNSNYNWFEYLNFNYNGDIYGDGFNVGNSNENTFFNNYFGPYYYVYGDGFHINSSSGNNFINNDMGYDNYVAWDYNFSDSSPAQFSFNVTDDLKFATGYGEIKFLDNNGASYSGYGLINGSGPNLSEVIKITGYGAFVNTTNQSGFNVSANITLEDVSVSTLQMIVDYEDDGEYAPCPASLCTNQSYSGTTAIFNVSHFTTFDVQDENVAPTDPTPILNSSDGSNKTAQNLNCYATVSDLDADTLYVYVNIYKNGVINITNKYIGSYPSGSIANYIFDSGNTTKTENWSCSMRLYDLSFYSNWSNSSNLTILNSPPVVTLSKPDDNTATTNRTPEFNWTAVDDDGDDFDYEISINEVLYNGGASCSDDREENLTTTSYIPPTNLICLLDNGYGYTWKVRANDSEGFGDWTATRALNITTDISFSLTTNEVNFGTMVAASTNDTSDDSPLPFIFQNDGTVSMNVSINASALWDSNASANDYFRFKIDNVSGEEGAFNWLKSAISWTQVPITGSVVAINELNYSASKDSAEIDVYVMVPPSEGAGDKSSLMIFTSTLAE